MIAYKSTVFYDAGRTTYQFPFLYMKKSFVKAKYIKGDGTAIYLVYNRDYQISGQTLTLNQSAPADVTILCIYRETPTDQQVRFVDASILKAYDLNTQGIQLLHIAEENTDTIRTNGLMFDDTTGTWHGMNRRLSHLSDPVNPQDAVTIHYLTAVDEARIKDMESLLQSTKNSLSEAVEAEKEAKEAEAKSRSYAQSAENARDETIQQADTARNYALNARAWAQSDTSPDNDSNAKSSKTWAKESKDAAAQAKTAENKATEASSDAKQSALNAQAQAASARTSSESVAALMTHLQHVNLYNPITTYTPGQCTMLPNGDVYRCIKACQGVAPGTDGGTNWLSIVSKDTSHVFNAFANFYGKTSFTTPVSSWYRIVAKGGNGGGASWSEEVIDGVHYYCSGGGGGSGETVIGVFFIEKGVQIEMQCGDGGNDGATLHKNRPSSPATLGGSGGATHVDIGVEHTVYFKGGGEIPTKTGLTAHGGFGGNKMQGGEGFTPQQQKLHCVRSIGGKAGGNGLCSTTRAILIPGGSGYSFSDWGKGSDVPTEGTTANALIGWGGSVLIEYFDSTLKGILKEPEYI